MKLIELISEKEIKEAVLGEYEKRLVLYKFANVVFKKKYSMSFKEFEEKNVIKEKGFSWEVEKDAIVKYKGDRLLFWYFDLNRDTSLFRGKRVLTPIQSFLLTPME